jgi:hypothetical protein
LKTPDEQTQCKIIPHEHLNPNCPDAIYWDSGRVIYTGSVEPFVSYLQTLTNGAAPGMEILARTIGGIKDTLGRWG